MREREKYENRNENRKKKKWGIDGIGKEKRKERVKKSRSVGRDKEGKGWRGEK